MSAGEAAIPPHGTIRAVVPGSFDPITRGHLDIIHRAVSIFDEVVVAVGRNSTKNYLFSPDERLRLVTSALAGEPGVRVEPLPGLLTDFCRARGIQVIVKGVRFGSDFDYELQMAQLNHALSGIETMLLPAGHEYGTISSTMLREVASHGGDISPFVTPEVYEAVVAKVPRLSA